jgi:Ca2+/H+ antiporter
MSNHFSELEDAWNQSKKELQSSPTNLEGIYEKIRAHKKENFQFYYGTIIILSLTLIIILCFFYFVAPVEELLSRIGAGFMLGGLIVRILFEIISINKAKKIHVLDNSLEAVDNAINFYQFRKKIHGIVAPVIITLYTIGFYLLTPEFLVYMDTSRVVLFDISYLFIAVFLFFQIRKGVRKEMETVKKTVALRKSLTREEA